MEKESTHTNRENLHQRSKERLGNVLCLKATRRGDETYIPKSFDVEEVEVEVIDLIKESISRKVFSEWFIEMLEQEINKI